MSSESQADTISRHPFFRAMVVMGGGIAVGCGGTTTDETSSSHGKGGDGGTGGDGGKSGTGGTIYLDAGAGRGGGSLGSGGRGGPSKRARFPVTPRNGIARRKASSARRLEWGSRRPKTVTASRTARRPRTNAESTKSSRAVLPIQRATGAR